MTARLRALPGFLLAYVRSVANETAARAVPPDAPYPPGQRRVVLFAQGRTGSTLLESLICSSGHFRGEGELLNCAVREVRDPLGYVRGVAKRRRANVFFHVKLYQLTRDRSRPVDPAAFLLALHDEGWDILYLRRRETARHVLSSLVAEQRGRYHKTDDRPEAVTVRIDRDRFARFVGQRRAFERAEREALAGLPFVEIVYEDDLEDGARHQATADRVFARLGLEPRPVKTRQRKVVSRPFEEVVVNHEELRPILDGDETAAPR